MRGLVLFISLVILLPSSATSFAAAISPELQLSLQANAPHQEMSIIINLADRTNPGLIKEPDKHLRRFKIVQALKDKAERTQGSLRAFLEGRGSTRIKPLWITNAIAATVPSWVISELERLPEVESIELDAVIEAPITTYGTTALPEWNLSAIKAPALWALGYTGKGVVVANLDTGVDIHHPDLKDKWRGGTNSWFNPYADPSNALFCGRSHRCAPCERSSETPCDADGHGTATMGIMVGGTAGGTAIGVAPEAQWIAVKVFNDAGNSATSIIHQGFQWLLDPDGHSSTNDAPDVVNASWASNNVNGCDLTFQPDFEALKAAGIAVVFAAGNEGPSPSTSVSPANTPGAFAVGAVDQSLIIASFSSRGPSACDATIFPEVVAPGANIRTSDLTGGGTVPDSYSFVDGTSFSAPHAAGAMALLLSAFPNLTVSELEVSLQRTALDLGGMGADNTYGAGLIDLLEAYQANGTGVVQYTLTLEKAGTGSGTVVSLPVGINCGSVCSSLYPGSQPITLSAIPADDSALSGWSGCTAVSGTACETILEGDKTVTATFSKKGIALSSPAGGENWPTYTIHTIHWTYVGDIGPYVRIDLLKGGKPVQTIARKVSIGSNGEGFYSWRIPPRLKSGNDYTLAITTKNNPAYTDVSDPFTITR
jgi:serine protease AprX